MVTPRPEPPGNGVLARVPGQLIAAAARQLPPAAATEREAPIRTAVVDVPDLGLVRITYRLNTYTHGRSRMWHWVATRADQVDDAGAPN